MPILPVFTHTALRVDYLTTASAANAALRDLVHEPVLGVDSEWRPNYVAGVEHPTALVQLACPTRILLVHLAAMRNIVPTQLISIINNENIVKTGVGIQHDISKLTKLSNPETPPLLPRSIVDLSTLARQADPGVHPGKMSNQIALSKLVELYTGKKLEKPRKVVMSNWEVVPLSSRQQLYAANDAYSSLSVYLRLQSILDTRDLRLSSDITSLDKRIPVFMEESSLALTPRDELSPGPDERPLKRRKGVAENTEVTAITGSMTIPSP